MSAILLCNFVVVEPIPSYVPNTTSDLSTVQICFHKLQIDSYVDKLTIQYVFRSFIVKKTLRYSYLQ